jgi:hypothetical protein
VLPCSPPNDIPAPSRPDVARITCRFPVIWFALGTLGELFYVRACECIHEPCRGPTAGTFGYLYLSAYLYLFGAGCLPIRS